MSRQARLSLTAHFKLRASIRELFRFERLQPHHVGQAIHPRHTYIHTYIYDTYIHGTHIEKWCNLELSVFVKCSGQRSEERSISAGVAGPVDSDYALGYLPGAKAPSACGHKQSVSW